MTRETKRLRRLRPFYRICCPPDPPRKSVGQGAVSGSTGSLGESTAHSRSQLLFTAGSARAGGPAHPPTDAATSTAEMTTMDATRRRRTRDRARQRWYAHERRRRFARFLGFTPSAPVTPRADPSGVPMFVGPSRSSEPSIDGFGVGRLARTYRSSSGILADSSLLVNGSPARIDDSSFIAKTRKIEAATAILLILLSTRSAQKECDTRSRPCGSATSVESRFS